jgi:hypothetical protein
MLNYFMYPSHTFILALITEIQIFQDCPGHKCEVLSQK